MNKNNTLNSRMGSSPFEVFLKILRSVQYVVLGAEEKDENEYFLSLKKSGELKFVRWVAVTFY